MMLICLYLIDIKTGPCDHPLTAVASQYQYDVANADKKMFIYSLQNRPTFYSIFDETFDM